MNGLELGPSDCNMMCAGTTNGERCGGYYRMLVYEITATQNCDYEAIEKSTMHELAEPEDQQIIGQPWDYQERFDTTAFVSTEPDSSILRDGSHYAGVCDV